MSKKLFVGGIAWATTEDSLRDAFSQVGEVVSANIIKDRMTGKSRGFGFVEMEDSSSENANSALDGHEVEGRALKVNKSKGKS
jgi:RNA recognition motif-containing protein